MIATLCKSSRCPVTTEHRERFLAMLPQIRQQALAASRTLGAEAQQEFLQAVVAASYVAYARLVELGRECIAYASPLAQFGIRHVRCGRSVGTPLNSLDISSRYAQISRRFQVQRLDRRYSDGCWKEVLVEDRRSGPAEVAAARIDVSEWFQSLPVGKRRIAWALACGDATAEVAERHGVSSSRISQLRSEFRTSWLGFQGELPPVLARRATPALCAG